MLWGFTLNQSYFLEIIWEALRRRGGGGKHCRWHYIAIAFGNAAAIIIQKSTSCCSVWKLTISLKYLYICVYMICFWKANRTSWNSCHHYIMKPCCIHQKWKKNSSLAPCGKNGISDIHRQSKATISQLPTKPRRSRRYCTEYRKHWRVGVRAKCATAWAARGILGNVIIIGGR